MNAHGNSATADKLKTARNIKLQGAVSGNASFDGSKDLTINIDIPITTVTKNTTKDKISVEAIFKKQLNIVTVYFKITSTGNDILTENNFVPEEYRPTQTISKTTFGELAGPVSSDNKGLAIISGNSVMIRNNGSIVFNCVNTNNEQRTSSFVCTYVI